MTAYTDEDFLPTVVGDYVAAGLARRDAAVVVATPAHTKAFLARLDSRGVDVDAALRRRQLHCLDAADALVQCMGAGAADSAAFDALIGEAIAHVRAGGHVSVRLYGEMVEPPWASDREAMLQLERVWGEILADRRLSLLCAYRLSPRDERVTDLLGQIGRHDDVARPPVFALRELPPLTVLSARRTASRSRRTR
jgi:hypothetical protein